MSHFACFVQGVQGLCRVLCRVFPSCAGCAGCFALSRACAREATPFRSIHAPRVRLYTLHTLHTLHTFVLYTLFFRTPCTTPCTPCTATLRARLCSFFNIFSQEKKMMEETPAKAAPTAAPVLTRRIVCTPANAPAFRELVKNTPRLLEVVEQLKAQGLFPGLRGMSVVITGSAETVAKGVDALLPKNGSKAV